MITRRTKVQLVVFVIITLLGVSYVGARYAQLDQLVRPTSYEVTAHFAESGGIFAGADVTYRGVGIGRVDRLVLTDEGVDVVLRIDDEYDDIPDDTLAVVGNRSAVGEQYVELQPQVDEGDVLEAGSEIAVEDTRTPIQTTTILTNLSNTVDSVDRDALRTTVDELGKAFAGTGDDLQQIIDTGNSFIQLADENLETTTRLIEDSNVVLNTQLASETSLRTFASQLALFSGTLADADPDLRKVIDEGSFAATQLRGFLEENRVDLGALLNDLVTTGEVVVKNLPGIQQVLVLYPYVVEGGFSVVSKSDTTPGAFDAHFGLIISTTTPCKQGYNAQKRNPTSTEGRENAPMDVNARCTEPITMSNPRGAQNLPRAGADYDETVIAGYDAETGEVTWRQDAAAAGTTLSSPATVAPRSLGKDAWKWLYLQPMSEIR